MSKNTKERIAEYLAPLPRHRVHLLEMCEAPVSSDSVTIRTLMARWFPGWTRSLDPNETWPANVVFHRPGWLSPALTPSLT